jgi:hypothetical protein
VPQSSIWIVIAHLIMPPRAKACLQLPAGDESRDEIDESSKASIGLFVSGCDASECLGVAEEVLDQVAPFVHFGIVRDAAGAIGFGRDDRCGPAWFKLARSQLLSKALSPISASKARLVIKGSTPPMLS